MRVGLFVLALGSFAACSSDIPTLGPVVGTDGGPGPGDGSSTDSTTDTWTPSPVEAVPVTETLHGTGLSAPIDIVRDEWGIPHIYGETLADVAYGQGYIVARDRFVQMDLARHQANGTIAELAGALAPTTLDGDVAIRTHHLRKTAEDGLAILRASSDPRDQAIVAAFASFAAGVNAYLDDVKAARRPEYSEFTAFDDFAKAAPWSELDSLALGQLQAFNLAFDAASEIAASLIDAKSAAIFDSATDPALALRKGLAADLQILAPYDPTYTIDGWTTASRAPGAVPHASRSVDPRLIALLEADQPSVAGLGNDHRAYPSRGSNNWVVGPALSATGHPLVANDTHLSLGNPATFYLVHLSARSGKIPLDVMGVAFPGIPGVILGMNEHVAWGATVNNIDVTDVYEETIVTCDDGVSPCVAYKGGKVKLLPRVETFNVGSTDGIDKTLTLTLYDVPHHGPIIARVTKTHDGLEPLGSTELSIRYTGHDPAQLARAQIGLDASSNMQEFVAALDRDFKYGGQNWVVADDRGHFGWTQSVRVPRRAPGHAPWKVLPGDGSAEWGADMDLKYVPHAYDPAKGFIATANNDPVGVTADDDPFFDEPMVDGAPLYLGAQYDPGTRVGRITKRLQAMTAGGAKLSLDDMQAIQSDAVTEWGEAMLPLLRDAATSLAAEIATPGSIPELKALASGASANVRALVPVVIPSLTGWTLDTPSGAGEDAPTAQQISDSQATLVMAFWVEQLYSAALSDELGKLGVDIGVGAALKLFIRATSHPELLKSAVDPTTHDAAFFDDLTTPEVESKRQTAVKALIGALDEIATALGSDASAWRWGQVHTLTLRFAISILESLQVPRAADPMFSHGYPRHGFYGTVDVANPTSRTDFTYASGPAIRFVCELDPVKGPRARNALPGGQTFDPTSPHYRDQIELWRKNKTFDLAFGSADVVASAVREHTKNGLGRIHIGP
jgi:penicillin amidase